MATNDVEETEQIIPNEEVEKVNEPVSYLFIVLFYFLGATCFIPNNFYVTANEYWMFKFRDPHIPFNNSDTQKTTLQKKFTAYTNMVGSIGMILFLFITFAISKKVSLQKRIVGGMFLLLVLFCITLLFVFVNTDSWQIGFFVIAVGISGLFSASTAVLLISLFQLSARFPPRCMAAQLAGQSVCGILSASIQVLTLLAAPTVKGTAGLYYAIATGVITATTIAYLTVSKKSEYLQNKLENDPEEEEEEEGEETSSKKFDIVKIKRVLRKLALILVSLTLCGVITQLLHPGLTALIESSGKGTSVWSDSYFLPVCVFLLFNTMEFIGRELSNHIQLVNGRDQHQICFWHKLRYGRVTTSRAFEFSRCKTNDAILIMLIMGGKISDASAMRRDRMLEENCKYQFGGKKCGIVLCKNYPTIAGSPDGICEDSIIEIKCTTNMKTFKKLCGKRKTDPEVLCADGSYNCI